MKGKSSVDERWKERVEDESKEWERWKERVGEMKEMKAESIKY